MSYQLIGLYKPLKSVPGFCHKIYGLDNKFFVYSQNNYVEVDQCEGDLIPIPSGFHSDLLDMVYKLPDGSFISYPKEQLKVILRERFRDLDKNPFCQMDVAEFLEDQCLINETNERCNELLKAKKRN